LTVTATIVTWNSEQYLSECLASLEQQVYPELEVSIVDNAF
jgi:GT2 family glycosyltransferase